MFSKNLRFKKRNNTRTRTDGSIDMTFLVTLISIVFFGLFMVYGASVVYSERVFGNQYHFLIQQSGWITVGLIGMYFVSKIDLDYVKSFAPHIFIGTILLLIFMLIPTPFAPEFYGASRWLVLNPEPFPTLPGLGRVSLQPSELAKLASVIFFAAYLSSAKTQKLPRLKFLSIFTFLLILVSGLVVLQPDFTTAFIIGIIIIGVLFFSNTSIWYFVLAGPVLISTAIWYAASSEYRRARIQTLFNPESIDQSGAGYHIRQVMIALGSGGLWGLGMGKSRQKYAYLPEVTADSIFAVIGEEFGFIGTSLLIILFVFLIWRGFKIAQKSKDMFSSLLVSGIIIWIAVQTLINLGSMVRLLPLTGVPLPLISYGGSATIFILWGLGLVLNVSRQVEKK